MTTLTRRAARLLCVGFLGKDVSPELKALIDLGVSGVILFSRNIEDAKQVCDLTRALKSVRREPLVVAVDQEGGSVRRLRDGFTELPALAALGASDDMELASEVGALLGRELSAVGVDWNLAPVLDVDTNPKNPVIGARSLGRVADRVASLGVALALSMQAAGVAACGKHFPGHGDTELDSHLSLPRLNHPLPRLERVELVPFAAAARAKIASIMTAHVLFSAIDAAYPATMSREVITGLLREKLRYDGLVASDDLEMASIIDHYGIDDAIVRGVRAGVDLFFVCHTEARMHAALEALVRALESGQLSERDFGNAERRAAAFTRRWGSPARQRRDLSALRSPAHLAIAERLSSLRQDRDASDPTLYRESPIARAGAHDASRLQGKA